MFRLPVLAWLAIWAVAFAALTVVSVRMSEGHLIYTLDDPYIHLAVAESIVRGGYGINPTEFSSPSSSVLYPFLLAALIALGLGAFSPLVINTIAMGLSVWLLIDLFWKRAVAAGPHGRVFAHLASLLLILGINSFALPLTGMEHTLHVLAVIVVMRGLVTLGETGVVSPGLVIATIVMPFIRFEGMALSGAAILAMSVRGHWRAAGASTASIVAGFCAWAWFTARLGLPFFPSSVLSKSNIVKTTQDTAIVAFLVEVVTHLYTSAKNHFGIFFALAICLILVAVQWRDSKRGFLPSAGSLIGGVALLALGAHLVAGSYDWFNRYEVYAVAIMLSAGIYLAGKQLTTFGAAGTILPQISATAALAVLVAPYVKATLDTPRASRGIYEQQYQMHRLATEFFPHPVAVNDIGWVAYRNDAYVLDLWGLGSETVRKLSNLRQLDADEIRKLADAAHVDFAMLYQDAFVGRIPDEWCLMAILKSEKVSAAWGDVSIYATRPSVVAELRQALKRLAHSLPARVTLQIERSACSR